MWFYIEFWHPEAIYYAQNRAGLTPRGIPAQIPEPRVEAEQRTHSGDETGTELIWPQNDRKKETDISHLANCFDI